MLPPLSQYIHITPSLLSFILSLCPVLVSLFIFYWLLLNIDGISYIFCYTDFSFYISSTGYTLFSFLSFYPVTPFLLDSIGFLIEPRSPPGSNTSTWIPHHQDPLSPADFITSSRCSSWSEAVVSASIHHPPIISHCPMQNSSTLLEIIVHAMSHHSYHQPMSIPPGIILIRSHCPRHGLPSSSEATVQAISHHPRQKPLSKP
jgi:hypothetical protein